MKTSPDHYKPWRDVAVFDSHADGKALTDLLSNLGIEARANDDKWFRYFLFLRPPQVTWRVQVRNNHFAETEALLKASPPAVLGHAIHCPSCASRRVNYPQMTRKFMLPTVLLHLGIIFRFIGHQCYCEHCHAMWDLPAHNAVVPEGPAIKPAAP